MARLDQIVAQSLEDSPGQLTGQERFNAWVRLAEAAVDDLFWRVSRLGGLCRSPVEELFLAELIRVAPSVTVFDPIEDTQIHVTHDESEPDWLLVTPQFPVGKFKVDFLIQNRRGKTLTGQVAVEIDGHNFHEKTKEQVAKDKARERAIVATGISVLRFSGSEVFRNPAACVHEIGSIFYPRAKK